MKGWGDGTKVDMLRACQSVFFVTGGNYRIWKITYFRIITKIAAWTTKLPQNKVEKGTSASPQFVTPATEHSCACTFPQGWYLTEHSPWKQDMYFLSPENISLSIQV